MKGSVSPELIYEGGRKVINKTKVALLARQPSKLQSSRPTIVNTDETNLCRALAATVLHAANKTRGFHLNGKMTAVRTESHRFSYDSTKDMGRIWP